MITIVQRGNPARIVHKRGFRCQQCEAVFLAEAVDFHLVMMPGGWAAYCDCPECGARDAPEMRQESFREAVERASMADEIAEQLRMG